MYQPKLLITKCDPGHKTAKQVLETLRNVPVAATAHSLAEFNDQKQAIAFGAALRAIAL